MAKVQITRKVKPEVKKITTKEVNIKKQSKKEIKVIELSKSFDPNRIASMLGIHLQEVNKILNK